MSTDARISTGLPTHPKTQKLIRRLGQAAAWNLLRLILWAADNRTDGDLSGMTAEDIELAADWTGEPGAFVRELASVRFLDGEDGAYALHDWGEHQPWIVGAAQRSAKARWNAIKKYHGAAEADRQVPEYAAVRRAQHADSTKDDAVSTPSSNAADQLQHASSTASSMLGVGCSNPPSPSPSPTPTLNTPLTPQGGKAAESLPGEDDPLFVQFYGEYPRKTGRADAWKAWKALKVTPELFARIMAGLALWKVNPRWTKDGGQFIKTPGPWLRQKLWADDEVCGGDHDSSDVRQPAGHTEVVL